MVRGIVRPTVGCGAVVVVCVCAVLVRASCGVLVRGAGVRERENVVCNLIDIILHTIVRVIVIRKGFRCR